MDPMLIDAAVQGLYTDLFWEGWAWPVDGFAYCFGETSFERWTEIKDTLYRRRAYNRLDGLHVRLFHVLSR